MCYEIISVLDEISYGERGGEVMPWPHPPLISVGKNLTPGEEQKNLIFCTLMHKIIIK
jgi:hypothetical protein